MTSDVATQTRIAELDAMDDSALCQLDWKTMTCLNGRLLELHAEGQLGNETLAKLPRRPILCIDQIDRIDEEAIEATFTFPDSVDDWAFDESEPLEMLFQDQLDQLVGFWGCRKADGIGRALSSGSCKLQQSLYFEPGKTLRYVMTKRKWMANAVSGVGGTAVFNGLINDDDGNPILDTKNVIVGILDPAEIQALRDQHGGTSGVGNPDPNDAGELTIPLYDSASMSVDKNGETLSTVETTQKITQDLWPLRYHFKGDPVVPGNFGTHGMIALVKEVARTQFGIADPQFISLAAKKFSGMIFEDPKQIRFQLLDVQQTDDNTVVAAVANLYLEDSSGNRMIEDPIYTFKKITVVGS